MWEAGSLIFRILTVGRQQHEQDQRAAKDAFDKTGKAAQEAGSKVDESGNATDRVGKKARDAKKPLDDQASATENVGKKSRQSSQDQDSQAASTEKQIESAKKLSAALTIAGVAVAALVGLSVAKYAEFDQAMSQTAAATMATAEQQRDLGEAALEAGADTAYSASEAAAAEEELAKAGISVADIVGGSLNGALALAAAGQLQVARSAEIMATTLKQYRLPAEDAAHVSDLLAAGAGKAQGSVDDLANALKFVGPIAASLGISLEETTGILALFAEQGILGEQAGTSLRGVLSSLTSPSALAAAEMKKYGVEVFDANGKMKTGAQIAQELHDAFSGLTEAERAQAMGRIFGNAQITAATILYEAGAQGVEKWTAAVDDSGYAAEQAAMRQDNLAGDIEKLGGAFDTALIRTGSGANDVLRTMVQMVTALVDWYGEIPAPIQSTALVVGVAAAAVLLFAGVAVGARAKFMELKLAMDATNVSMGRTALIGGAAGLALTGVVTVLALIASAHAEAEAKADSYADTLEEGSARVTKSTREMAKEALAADQVVLGIFNRGSTFDAAEKLGLSFDLVTDAALGNKTALEELKRQIDEGADGSLDYANAATVVLDGVNAEAGALDRATEKQRQKQDADEGSTESSKTAAGAYLEAAGAADDLESELSELIDTINEANGVGQDAVSANISYQDALAKVDEAIAKARAGEEGYALTLDQTTQVGRDNLGMLNDMTSRSQAAADAQFALDGNTQNYRATMEAGRQSLIDRAMQMGYNADEAARLADQIYRIPSETEWKVIAETQTASTQLQGFITRWDGKRINISVGTTGGPAYQLPGSTIKYQANGAVIESYASGGMREQHVAQMARAGAWRVWAEPETGGETYIPHAPQKRARSEALLAETAAIFGGVYIPSGAARFADGSSGSTAPTTLRGLEISGRLTFDPDGFVRLVDGRIIEARTEAAGKLTSGESSL